MTSFLRRPHLVEGELRRRRLGAVEELRELGPGHAGGELGETRRRNLRKALEPVGRHAPPRGTRSRSAGVGAEDLDLTRRRGAHQLRVELGEALGHQHDDDVLGEQHRVLRPLAQVDQDGAILRRAVRGLARGHQRLGERQHQHHRSGRLQGRAVTEVGVEQREGVAGVARQGLAPGGAVHRVVGLQPVDEVLFRLRRGESEPLGAVVRDPRRPAGEEHPRRGRCRAS